MNSFLYTLLWPLLVVVVFVGTVSCGWGGCEPLTIPICQQVKYTSTILPNFEGHRSQNQTIQATVHLMPLINSNCSKDIVNLYCAYYAPICITQGIDDKAMTIRPCWTLCNQVRNSCDKTVKRLFGKNSPWFWKTNCNSLPKTGLCFGRKKVGQPQAVYL